MKFDGFISPTDDSFASAFPILMLFIDLPFQTAL